MALKTRLFDRNFVTILLVDALLLAASWYSAYLLRFNFEIPLQTRKVMLHVLPFIVGIKILCFYFFDLYQGMWRYTGITDLWNIIKAVSLSSLIMASLILFIHGFSGFARSIFIIDWTLTILFVSGYRVSVRLFFWLGSGDNSARISTARLFNFSRNAKPQGKNLLIIGAGDCGEHIYREIRENPRLRYNVIGFIDDEPAKVGKKIHGTPVLGKTSELNKIVPRFKADEALIAIPSSTSQEMRNIVSELEQSGVPYKTVPGMGELIDGKVSVKSIRDVAYRDLLGREVIRLEEELIGGYIERARVLVTGAGGSIGSELCRQICRFRPEAIILYERAESALYDIELELKEAFPYIDTIPVLADIQDRTQLSHAFSANRPGVVFHAAAYKHVPMMELQPWKAVINNILGTQNVIDVSSMYSVERFVFVSTDKAVRPSNVMGASKRVAELFVQGQQYWNDSSTRFVIVRFGNVVGSIGSVVPLFRKQIEKGGPVTVTHPDVTRYFMTIPEACQLILQAGAMGKGGEIFILDMGTPVKIADMARDLIRLSGLEPDTDIRIEYIGLRPGEKLYEELITEGENIVPTSHEKIMVLRGGPYDRVKLNGKVGELSRLAGEQDAEGIRLKLKEIIPEYMWQETK